MNILFEGYVKGKSDYVTVQRKDDGKMPPEKLFKK
jgi:hypothetical protein